MARHNRGSLWLLLVIAGVAHSWVLNVSRPKHPQQRSRSSAYGNRTSFRSSSSSYANFSSGRFVRLGSPQPQNPIPVLDLSAQLHVDNVPPLLPSDLWPRRKNRLPELEPSPEWVASIDEMLGIQRTARKAYMKSPTTMPSAQTSHQEMPRKAGFQKVHHAAQQADARSDQRSPPPARPTSRPDQQAAGFGANAVVLGMKVERGPHWQWGDQDGGIGSVGIVIGEIRQGWCTVRWPSGYSNGYRVGDGGHYDLRVVRHGTRSYHPAEKTMQSKLTPAALKGHVHSTRLRPGAVLDSFHVTPGLHVQRGPDWRWGNQDGGPGSIGIVQGDERRGWAKVRWPSGVENGYRVGEGGKYDLMIAEHRGVQIAAPRASKGRQERNPVLEEWQRHQMMQRSRSATGCAARGRTRCWCIDQYGDVLELP